MLLPRPSRRRPAGLLAILALALGPTACDRPRPRPPSLLLISIDTLRRDHVHAYGYAPETTPVLDQLAAAGVRCDQHITNTSWTLPSHASMLTGLAETVHLVDDDDRVIDPARTTLAEALTARGYRAAGFFSGPYLHPTYGFGQGFEVYESAIVLRKPKDREPNWHLVNDVDRMRLIERNSYQQRTGPELVARATAWLDSLAEDEPFFLFLHFFDCHWDYMPPEAYWRKFDPDFDDPTFDGSQFVNNPDIHAGMQPRRLAHLIARYDGEILFTDERVGEVLDHLQRLGRRGDTLISVTADHGEEFFEHGEKGHRNNLYDESIRVPWIVSWPDHLPQGVVVGEPTAVIDVMPTLLDLLGVTPPAEVSGRSVAPLFHGTADAELAQRPAFGRLILGQAPRVTARFLRTPDRKLLATRADSARIEALQYFDLKGDPGEHTPLQGRSDASQAERSSMHSAWQLLIDKEARDRARVGQLRFDARDAAPHIDAELRRQLQENGYLGGG